MYIDNNLSFSLDSDMSTRMTRILLTLTPPHYDNASPLSRLALDLRNSLSAFRGVHAEVCPPSDNLMGSEEIIHIFDLGSLEAGQAYAVMSRKRNSALALSPRLGAGYPTLIAEIKDIFSCYYNEDDLRRRIEKAAKTGYGESLVTTIGAPVSPGISLISNCLDIAGHVIFFSNAEKRLFEAKGLPHRKNTILMDPIDIDKYASATPLLFSARHNICDYVLCVGPLLPVNNQLLLARALGQADMPQIYIGSCPDLEYARLVKENAGRRALFIPEIEEEMLASAYVGAKVVCQPALADLSPLQALQAAAVGRPAVMPAFESQKEYLEDLGFYCQPWSIDSIRDAVLQAYSSPQSCQAALKTHVKNRFSLAAYTEAIATIYNELLAERAVSAKPERPNKIYIDLTFSAYSPNTGIARVETSLADKIYDLEADSIVFVYWDRRSGNFYHIDRETLASGEFIEAGAGATARSPAITDTGGVFLMLGGYWFTHDAYIIDMYKTCRQHSLALAIMIHDLIPFRLPYCYEPGFPDKFAFNLKKIISISFQVLCVSKCTAKDVAKFCLKNDLPCPSIRIVRLGDNVPHPGKNRFADPSQIMARIGRDPFVLIVSGMIPRKNHEILFHVWKKMLDDYGSATPHLICIGIDMYGSGRFTSMVDRDPLIKERIHIFNDVDDVTLDWLYKRCLFTVYPSLYEGWGLPVAESLAYGKICAASNASSIPEIAPEYTDLVHPLDFPSWFKVITRYAFHEEIRKSREREISSYRRVSWNEAARSVLEDIMEIPSAKLMDPICAHDQTITVSSDNDSWRYLLSGWGEIEKQGALLKDREGVLAFRTPNYGEQIIFKAKLSAALQPEGQIALRITINDTQILDTILYDSVTEIEVKLQEISVNHSCFAEYNVRLATPYSDAENVARRHGLVKLLAFGLAIANSDVCSM